MTAAMNANGEGMREYADYCVFSTASLVSFKPCAKIRETADPRLRCTFAAASVKVAQQEEIMILFLLHWSQRTFRDNTCE
jgi:hypothetical protein